MHILDDDLGEPVAVAGPPRRVVSLVPSLTEALAASVPGLLVGATDWCSHPDDLDVVRVRGTKNPDHAAIGRLRPDLVVANREENRRVDVERLRAAGIPVWVTAIESVDQAIRSLRRLLVDLLDVGEPPWLRGAEASWNRPPEFPGSAWWSPSGGIPGWWWDRRPSPATWWPDSGCTTWPTVPTSAIRSGPGRSWSALGPDLVLFPDEPYPFSEDDGPAEFPDQIPVLVSGRDLTWYGPSMATARAHLVDRINAARAGERRSSPGH